MRFILLLLSGLAGLIALLRGRWLFGLGDDWVPPPPPGRRWLTCTRGSGEKASKIIGHEGDTIPLHGHLLDVPRGAVPQGQSFEFTLREAKTREVMVNVKARSIKGSGKFEGRVNLRVSYARCAGDPAPGRELELWRHRPQDGLRHIPGTDDPRAKIISVMDTRISRFAVGTH